MAELTLLAKTADFHDGEEDKAERGLSAVDSDEEAEENDSEDEDEKEESLGKMSSQGSFVEKNSFPPLTAAQLQLLAEQDDTEPAFDRKDSKDVSGPVGTQKKRTSIFERIK